MTKSKRVGTLLGIPVYENPDLPETGFVLVSALIDEGGRGMTRPLKLEIGTWVQFVSEGRWFKGNIYRIDALKGDYFIRNREGGVTVVKIDNPTLSWESGSILCPREEGKVTNCQKLELGQKVKFVNELGSWFTGGIVRINVLDQSYVVQNGIGETSVVKWGSPTLTLATKEVEFSPRERLSRSSYFMHIAGLVSQRSTCLHRPVGAVIVLDNHILSTGYNGAPVGMDHCHEIGCARVGMAPGMRLDLCRAAHAEINAICFAARHGTTIKGSTLYTTTFPCGTCAKAILNSGIIQVVYHQEYFDEAGYEILKRIEVELYKGT